MKIASDAPWGTGTPRMNMGLRKPPASTTLRDMPSVAASLSIRIAFVVQLAKNRAKSKGAQRYMATIATCITTIVNGRGHSSAFLQCPGTTGTYGRCCSRSGAVRYSLSLGLPRTGRPSPNRRINKTREIGHVRSLACTSKHVIWRIRRCVAGAVRRRRARRARRSFTGQPVTVADFRTSTIRRSPSTSRARTSIAAADRRSSITRRCNILVNGQTRPAALVVSPFPNNGRDGLHLIRRTRRLHRRHRPDLHLQPCADRDQRAGAGDGAGRADHNTRRVPTIDFDSFEQPACAAIRTHRRSPTRARTRPSSIRTRSPARTSRSTPPVRPTPIPTPSSPTRGSTARAARRSPARPSIRRRSPLSLRARTRSRWKCATTRATSKSAPRATKW